MSEEEKKTEAIEVKKGWWNSKTNKGKVWFVVSMVLLAVAITFLITLLFAREIYTDEFADELYGAGVKNGFEAIGNSLKGSTYKLILSVVIIICALLFSFLINFLIKLCTLNASKRALTTGSIIKSLFRYLIIMVAIAMLLTTWGVNVTGIVASLGVLTLIIGLGCQSLINDIVSGIFIVFDDYFSVGDMIIVDGFRGYVEEIGLRAIKVSDHLGNIKAINNSSISTVVNLSRQLTHVSITMDASYSEDIQRCEAIFVRELPKIKEKMPMIYNGPIYKGIDNFDNGSISFAFGFDTRAEYRFQATRDFKREIYMMFLRNNITVPYKQITVNPPDTKERAKATEEDIKLSNQVDKKNKSRQTPTKKVKFKNKIAKAYNDALKDDAEF